MQQSNISESDYGGYVIHLSLKITYEFANLDTLYLRGEIILSSVKACRERRKCVTSFEQKADGVFSVRLKKSSIEVGHLEISGGYGDKDLPRSTWDGCCKLPIGNAYMLEEIGERFRGASLQDEHSDSDMKVSNLSGVLPPHPLHHKKINKKGITAAYADSDPDFKNSLNMLPPKPNYQLVETIPLKLKYDPAKKLNLLRLQSKKKTDLKNFTPPVKLIRKDPNAREYNKDNNNTFSRSNVQTLPTSNSSSSSSITANITTTGGSTKNSQAAGGVNRARQNKKMLFKKRTTQVFLADEETRKLKAEERLPWVLEDFGGSNTWVGQYCNTEDVRYGGMFHKTNEKGEKYVEFKQLSHWYEFKPKPKFTPLTIEEAEEIMGKAKKRENDRWFMRRSGKNDKEREMAEKEGGIYDNKSNLKAVENETDLIRSDDEGESKFHGKYEDEFEEMDYEQVFEDDEEDNLDLQNPEDVKDPVLVKTKFFSGTAEEEFEEDKERNKLTAEGKNLKKLVRTLEKNVAYDDSDKESDPYASSVELDGTDDEEESQNSQSLPSSLNSAKLISPPKSEKGKSTTKSGAKSAQTKTKATATTNKTSSSSSTTTKSKATAATTAADKPKNKSLTSAKKGTASSTPSSSAPATPNSTTTSKPKASTKSVTIKTESKSDSSTAIIGSPSSSSTTLKKKKSKPAAGSSSSDSNLITEKEICVLIRTKKKSC
ncbi:10818_t:CDS:2 [Entrophospora sp. SA101]|nr:10818_t:CDS:2 [Entrophospora sp. SA101]